MKNTQKGFAKIWFIFGLVIIAVISFVIVKQGCWIVGKFYFKSTCESTSYSTQNETANWKTYRNNEYGFEFKYPKDYVIKSDTNTISIGNDNYASLYVISLTNNVSNISPDKYIEELRQKGVEEHYAPIVSSSKKIAVNNVNGIDAVLVAAMGVPERNIFLPLKDKLLNFSYFLGESANYVLEEYFRGNQNEFEQYLKNGDFILSTFKFTNSQQNTNVEAQMRTAVEKVLAEGKLPNPSLVMPKGIRLLSIKVVENRVTLDFSKEITSGGQGVFEDIFSLISNAIHPIIETIPGYSEYKEPKFTLLVEGKPDYPF